MCTMIVTQVNIEGSGKGEHATVDALLDLAVEVRQAVEGRCQQHAQASIKLCW